MTVIGPIAREASKGLLSMCEGFDVEAESWTDAHNVLAVELLEDRGFPGIVKASKGGKFGLRK
jgi:hypothetical protein